MTDATAVTEDAQSVEPIEEPAPEPTPTPEENLADAKQELADAPALPKDLQLPAEVVQEIKEAATAAVDAIVNPPAPEFDPIYEARMAEENQAKAEAFEAAGDIESAAMHYRNAAIHRQQAAQG